MGNKITTKYENQNFDYQEKWKYNGAIYQNKLNKYMNEYQTIKIESLKGYIYIKRGKKNREIKIEGKTKNSKGKDKKENYIFYGEEIINNQINVKRDYDLFEKIIFKIQGENKFQLNYLTINKYNNESTKASADNIYTTNEKGGKDGPYFLDLHLSSHMENNKQIGYEKINISNLELLKLLKLDNPQDILINSICGMKNLINTCYINSSFQILIHIPEFIKIMRNNSYFKYDNIIKQINNIYDQILEKYKQYKPIINPKSFVNYFKSNHYTYNNYSQMDSEMFLEELIWDINIELGNLGFERNNDLFTNYIKTEIEIDFLNYIN